MSLSLCVGYALLFFIAFKDEAREVGLVCQIGKRSMARALLFGDHAYRFNELLVNLAELRLGLTFIVLPTLRISFNTSK